MSSKKVAFIYNDLEKKELQIILILCLAVHVKNSFVWNSVSAVDVTTAIYNGSEEWATLFMPSDFFQKYK